MCVYAATPDQPNGEPRLFEVDCSVRTSTRRTTCSTSSPDPTAPTRARTTSTPASSPTCTSKFIDYVGRAYEDSRLDFMFLYPSEDAWHRGVHEVVCVLNAMDDELLDHSMVNSRE